MKPFVFDAAAFTRDFNRWRGERGLRGIEKQLRDTYGDTVSAATLSRIGLGKQPDLSTIGILCAAMGKNPGDYWRKEDTDALTDTQKAFLRIEYLEVALRVAGIPLFRPDPKRQEGRTT